MVLINAVHKDLYADSVALMRVAALLAEAPGIDTVSLVMGTPANKDVLTSSALLAEEGEAAGPNDLLVAVRGERAATQEALTRAAHSLRAAEPAQDTGTGPESIPLRSLATAPPATDLAVISTPGAYAAAEARKALRRGMHAFVFSDHMSVEDEAALKEEADGLGLLVMGPDCGTALIGGVPLGFANAVRRGPIGLAGASGTGLQQVACLLHARGSGVSHLIGTGSRDLGREVGGRTMLAAIDALSEDPATETLVLVSKPPDPAVAQRVLRRAAASGKPVVACFLGWEGPVPDGVVRADTLAAAAELAAPLDPAEAATATEPTARPGTTASPASSGHLLRALYTGGTFAYEARHILTPRLGGAPARDLPAPAPGARPDLPGQHLVLDLGDDAYTAGRPHPMIDPTVRAAFLHAALTDPATAVVLVDVVLGHGAAPDPAAAVAEALSTAARQRPGPPPVLVAFVVGTDEDPQPATAARHRLRAAGALLADSSTAAAHLAAAHLPTRTGGARA